jgi:hypothetical protein
VLSDQKRLKEEKISEWEKGLRPNNELIGNYRDAEYAIFKERLNPFAKGHVDLLYTRQTANSLFVHRGTSNGLFTFGMNDRYNLIGRYGLDILGLNQETFDKRQNDIYKYTLIYTIKKDYKIA